MTVTDNQLPQLLTIEQLAAHLGVTPRHIRRLIAERRIPHLKVGRFVRFDPADVSTWLRGTTRPAGGLRG
jgi:excisionase family DNA binding protein